MTAIADEVKQTVPQPDDWPLLRGLIVGLAIGATIAGVIIVGRELQARRVARRHQRGIPPSPPPGAEPSPL